MNTVQTPKETVIDQGKDGQINSHEDEQGWNGLHSVSATENKVCFGN
jgi:hypothetical protein